MLEPEHYLEIQWHGRAGQGALTAAAVLAEILAMEGKYVQAFPEFHMEKKAPSINAFNRISGSPIKLHAAVKNAGIVMVMEPTLILSGRIGQYAEPGAVYIVNTSYSPEAVKEKMTVAPGDLYTLDADTIARQEIGKPIPNIPMMAVIFRHIDWMAVEGFKQQLTKALSAQWGDNPELVAANLKTVERALHEVQKLEVENNNSTTIND
jgi:pyruvate ferredoxin oxidoreductase gamma subunit